ncbi:MAG: DNA repair exonuclease [Desulfatiglandales bacterium]
MVVSGEGNEPIQRSKGVFAAGRTIHLPGEKVLMFKFIHAADIHLDSPLHRLDVYEGAPMEELRQAARKAFDNLVALALREKVAFVVIAGDLYDGDWKDYNTGLYFVSQMSRLAEADIPVYIVAGNHDAASKITKSLRLPEGVILLASDAPQTVTLDAVGVAVHGQSFPKPAVKKNLARDYPDALPGHFNIGLLHTCATGREGHEPYAPCSLDDFRARGYDYWALGHVHQREILLDRPLTVFPGNIQGRHVGETGAKGCMLVTVDDRGRAEANFSPLDVVRWFRIEVNAAGMDSGYDLVDATVGRIEELLAQNEGLPLVARVEVAGDCPAHEQLGSEPEHWAVEIRSAALDRGGGRVWIEKLKIRTRLPVDPRELDRAGGPITELLDYLDEIRSDPALLESLGGVLDDLVKKLPRELREGKEAPYRDQMAWLVDLIGQVQPMLISRLKARWEHT